jgi:peroxiredoxin
MTLRAGDLAPDFSLPSTDGEVVTLSAFRGGWVVLVFVRWLG